MMALKQNKARAKACQELVAIPVISLTIRTLNYWGYLFGRNWRLYLSLSLSTSLNFMQFLYMSTTREAVDIIIRNAYMLVLWLNTVLRGYLMFCNYARFEKFLDEFIILYKSLLNSNDKVILGMLMETNALGKNTSNMNMVLGLMTSMGFCIYPLFADERMLPYGIYVPGIDEMATPFFEMFYIHQVVITPIGCFMYIAFGSLITSLIQFAILLCKVLQHRLELLNGVIENTDEYLMLKIKSCIKYQETIYEYVNKINNLTTYVFLVEFLCFGTLLCGLLFLINIAETTAQLVIAAIQISMIFTQVLTLYWYASQLSEESGKVGDAAYNINWFSIEKPLKMNILMLILRAQSPCQITVGNVYPMTLEMFQSLLNASYSYFTLLRRFYD